MLIKKNRFATIYSERKCPINFWGNCLDGTSGLRRASSLQIPFKQFQSFIWIVMFGISDRVNEANEKFLAMKNLHVFPVYLAVSLGSGS